MRGKRWWLLGAAGVVAAVVVVALILLGRAPHNVSHPNLSFTAPTKTTTTRARPKPPRPNNFLWPYYGYTAARTRAFDGNSWLKPPFRRGWTLGGNALIEFPPSIHGYNLYFMDDSATVKDVDARNGHIRWQHQIGKLSAASPALSPAHGLLYVPTLSDTSKTPGNGQIAALSLRTGRAVWDHHISSGTESSPLISGKYLYFGTQAGTVYALNAKTGARIWSFQGSGAVKGGPALSGGLLYFDDYGGHVYAVNAHTGRQVWVAGTSGAFGLGSGTFYSTPTVAWGRVYVGNTNGYVYSFAARTGQLAWSRGTGAYVYSSAAADNVPGLGPTVFMGSYDGNFYAFNAQSGATRWVHRDADRNRISGSATVVDGVVYYSNLDDKLTTGLDERTGHTVFTFHDGAFSPVVAAPAALFVSGGYTEYELIPKDRPHAARRAHAKRRHHAKAKHHPKAKHHTRAKHHARSRAPHRRSHSSKPRRR